MLQGLDTALATLFIIWVPLLVGCIPVVIGWSRITFQLNGSDQRKFPKALLALTASICAGPIGLLLEYIYGLLAERIFNAVDFLPLVLATFVVLGVLADLAAILMSFEKNSARPAVLIGSIAVGLVNVVGLALFFSSSRGISMWND